MCVFNWNAVYPTISYHYVSLDNNHRTQMLRVSDIFPQAVSGSLADVVGSCVGSHRAASGSLVWLCCWSDAWPALSSWIPFPPDSPWVLWSFILCKSLMQSLDEPSSKGRRGPFFLVVSMIAELLSQVLRKIQSFTIFVTILFSFLNTPYPDLMARVLAKWFCTTAVLSDFYVWIHVIFKSLLFSHLHYHE